MTSDEQRWLATILLAGIERLKRGGAWVDNLDRAAELVEEAAQWDWRRQMRSVGLDEHGDPLPTSANGAGSSVTDQPGSG